MEKIVGVFGEESISNEILKKYQTSILPNFKISSKPGAKINKKLDLSTFLSRVSSSCPGAAHISRWNLCRDIQEYLISIIL